MQRTEKHCPACNTTKPLTEWPRNRARHDGYGSRCTTCHKTTYGPANREAARTRNIRNRREAERIYGGTCVKCGSTTRLEFDHIHGDGHQHRQHETTQAMYRRIARTGRPLTDTALQLLCHTHHWEKTRTNGETRRTTRDTSHNTATLNHSN